MTRREVNIRNDLGLHLRSASNFVRLASRFQSDILVGTADVAEVDGKSILGLATLGAARGTSLIITADGPDEVDAVQALVQLVEEKFHED